MIRGDVLYFGHIFNASGYATGSRGMILALHAAGCRVRVVPISQPDDTDGILLPAVRNTLHQLKHTPIAVEQALCIHAHGADTWQMHTGARHVVGRTMFETDRLPPGWAHNCNGVHEIWVPSTFNVDTFKRAGVEPSKFRLLPEGVDTDHFRPGLPPLPVPGSRAFNFLSVFDWQYRKGWDILLRAYLHEFTPDEDVALILKVYQYNLPHQNIAAEIEAFRARETGATGGPPIILLRDYVGEAQMPQLYAAAQAFVLPTRGEGFGRPMLEAMACGLPTLATNWGGHLDFMTNENAYLIQCQAPVPVAAANDLPVFNGHAWAEPDVNHLRSLMRQVFTRREEAAARSARARQDVVAGFDLGQVHARFLREVERVFA